jgi:ABC-type transport system involved in multi-copper enzyme maturation permease subunit
MLYVLTYLKSDGLEYAAALESCRWSKTFTIMAIMASCEAMIAIIVNVLLSSILVFTLKDRRTARGRWKAKRDAGHEF